MSRMFILSVIVGAILSVPVVADYSVGTASVSVTPGLYKGWGGEYTIYDATLDTSAYAASTSDQGGKTGSFQAFCLEQNEYVHPPETGLLASVGTGAIKGGVSGGNPDYVGSEVGWLYTQFATENLKGYAYGGTIDGLTRVDTAGALQRVIWSLEGEGYGTGWDVDVANTWGGGVNWVGQPVKQSLITALIDSWEAAYQDAVLAGWTGIGNVRVLNLERLTASGAYEPAQSQLYLLPAPLPGAVLLGLLGLGYAGMKLRRMCN